MYWHRLCPGATELLSRSRRPGNAVAVQKSLVGTETGQVAALRGGDPFKGVFPSHDG